MTEGEASRRAQLACRGSVAAPRKGVSIGLSQTDSFG
jgi:hypothetical protein